MTFNNETPLGRCIGTVYTEFMRSSVACFAATQPQIHKCMTGFRRVSGEKGFYKTEESQIKTTVK